MKELKIYRAIDALPLMGILAEKTSVTTYINNLYKDGMFKTSYKLNNRWCITEEDVLYIRQKIMSRDYKPSAKWRKQAA